MKLHETSDDRQTESQPSLRPVQRLRLLDEALEYAFEHVARNADAVVAHTEPGPIARRDRRHANGRSGPAVLRSIGQKIGNHLCQAVCITIDHQALEENVQVEPLLLLVQEWAHHLQPSRDHDGELETAFSQCNLAARDARNVEQVFDQPDEVADLPLDDRDFSAMAAAHPGEVKSSQDWRKRIAQLVPKHRQEFVLGAHCGIRRVGGVFQLRP